MRPGLGLTLALSHVQSQQLACTASSWARDEEWRAASKALMAGLTDLNFSQKQAVARGMLQTLTLWQVRQGGLHIRPDGVHLSRHS